MGWIITILALGIVIAIHEFGHLLVAKWNGIAAPEFSVGMGPKLFGKRIGSTEYNLRLLPIGGFVKIAGLDNEDPPPGQSYFDKSFFARFSTVIAGPLMNIALGIVIFSFLFAIYGGSKMVARVDFVKPGSPAALAGLQVGDKIRAVDSTPVQDAKRDIIGTIRHSHNRPLQFDIQRGTQVLQLRMAPQGAVPQVGIILGSQTQHFTPLGAIQEGVFETGRQIQMMGITLKMLVSGQAGLKDLAGPVGIVQMATLGLSRSFGIFLGIMGMISVGLGMANLLPIPILDGGHIVLLCIEKIIGRRLSPKVEEWMTYVGLAIIVTLMALVVGNDVLHWQDRIALLKGMK